jgi:hypothetical protein
MSLISRSDLLLQKMLTSPLVQQLYNQASEVQKMNKRVQNIVIEFLPDASLTSLAEADYKNGKISIRSSVSDEMAISCAIFELSNIVQSPKFDEVNEMMLTQYSLGSECFVKMYEKIEYDGCVMHHQIIERAFREMGAVFTPDVDLYYRNAAWPFETVWPSIQTTVHAHVYRTNFRAQLDEIFKRATNSPACIHLIENNSVFCPSEHCLGTSQYWFPPPVLSAPSSAVSPSSVSPPTIAWFMDDSRF